MNLCPYVKGHAKSFSSRLKVLNNSKLHESLVENRIKSLQICRVVVMFSAIRKHKQSNRKTDK